LPVQIRTAGSKIYRKIPQKHSPKILIPKCHTQMLFPYFISVEITQYQIGYYHNKCITHAYSLLLCIKVIVTWVDRSAHRGHWRQPLIRTKNFCKFFKLFIDCGQIVHKPSIWEACQYPLCRNFRYRNVKPWHSRRIYCTMTSHTGPDEHSRRIPIE
jgi:hypothetical protein